MSRHPAHPPVPATSRERGVSLLFVSFLVVVLGGLSLAFFEEGMAEHRDVVLEQDRFLALQVAEAGALRAEIELTTEIDADGDGLGNVAGTHGPGAYDVVATEIQPNQWHLDVRAEVRGVVRRLEVGLDGPAASLFPYAMFGKDDVELSGGSWTDSYDSRLGSWADQATNWYEKTGWYADTGGHIGSNGGILVGGGGVVRGDAVPGPFDITDLTGGSSVTGSVAPRSEPADMPPPPIEDFVDAYLNNDVGNIDTSDPKIDYDPTTGVLKMGGVPIELPGGTYFFTDWIISGGGTVVIKGKCTIYITGDLNWGGGTVSNLTGQPQNCLVYAHPYSVQPGFTTKDPMVKTSGGSGTAMAVYAPELPVEVSGGGEFFGALVGLTAKFSGGSGFHYDRALGDLGGGASGNRLERTYWVDPEAPPPLP